MSQRNIAIAVACAAILTAVVPREAVADTYSGPDRPTLSADDEPISTAPADCSKAVEELTAWSPDESRVAAARLCRLRRKHRAARRRLLGALAGRVQKYKGETNHDHDANLASTIELMQLVVARCIDALESQQYCHNVACLEEPEENAAFCEAQAAVLAERI